MGPRRNRAVIATACALAAALATVPAGAQESPPATTTVPESTTTTAPPQTPSTSVPQSPPGGDPAPGPEDPGPGFTIPEPPERQAPPEEAPLDNRPPRDALIPPPIDLDSLNAVVESRRVEATAGARSLADQANAEALREVAARMAILDGLQTRLPTLETAVDSAREAERSAVTQLERAKINFGDIAAEAYTLAVAGGGALAQASVDAIEGLDGFENLVKTSQYSGAAWKSLRSTVEDREATLADAKSTTSQAILDLTSVESQIAAATGEVDRATENARQVSADGEELVTLAGQIGEDLSVDGLGPTILGETILGPEDLASFSSLRPNAPDYGRLVELAEYFVEEGESEGVRGDIAWAQSILETGNFGYRGSMVSTSDNNFAGIGACDSCSSGFSYDSARLGVRAQMQLLRAYADDNLTSDQLGNPPVGRAPERVGVRGCCDTWMELSGVWATGPGYGVKILTLYNEMLAHAARRQAAGLR